MEGSGAVSLAPAVTLKQESARPKSAFQPITPAVALTARVKEKRKSPDDSFMIVSMVLVGNCRDCQVCYCDVRLSHRVRTDVLLGRKQLIC